MEFADSRLWIDRHAGAAEQGRGGAGLGQCDLYCGGRTKKRVKLVGYIHDFPTYVSRGNVVADNHITFYDSISVSGFQSNHGRVQDLVENNRFEGNSINLVQGTTKRFRIGSEYLDLEQAQQRGQEKHSRAEFVPSGTSHSFDMKCPPNVGRREERK